MAKEKQAKKQQKTNENTTDAFKALRAKIAIDNCQSSKLPSIVEFVNNKEYLGLPFLNPPTKLFDLQSLILKCFYRGSNGNENLVLTPEELEFIEKNGLNEERNGALVKKWNLNNQFRELVLVWGRRCLSENCEIVDPDTGKIWTFGELWNYGKTSMGSWTYDENTKYMTAISDCNLVRQGKRDVFQIQTASGHQIEVTDNHPLFTETGWVEMKDLKIKDKIAISSYQPFFGKSEELTEDEAFILGYLTSSSCDSVGCYIATSLKDGDVFANFKEKLKSINSNLNLEIADNYNLKILKEKKYSFVAEQKIKSSEKNVINLLYVNGIKNKTESQKFVPARIFISPKNIVVSYLKALFSSDGSIYISKASRYSSKIEISFYNITLTRQIQHLLSRFGIFSVFQSKLENGKPEYVLCINKNSYVRRFMFEIGFLGQEEKSKDILENVEEDTSIDSLVFSPVTQIRRIGLKNTFDLQVSNKKHLQNFVSNGFVCHNCVSENGILIDARTGERFTFKQAWKDEKIISSWTYDENQKKMVVIDDCNIISQGRRMVYKVTDSFGHEIEVTDNHPFLTQRGWVQCKELKTGDRIAVPESIPFFGASDAINEHEAAVLGYMTGDGNCSQAALFFTAKNEEILEDLKYHLSKISDNLEVVKDTWTTADSKEMAYKIRSKEYASLKYYDEGLGRNIATRDKNDLMKLLIKHDLAGKTSHEKCVPEALHNCPKNIIAAYLRSLFSCDGCIYAKEIRKKFWPAISFSTVNKQQAKLVQELLHRFGILSTIRQKIAKTKITTEGKTYHYNDSISYEVYFNQAKFVKSFVEQIGFFGKENEQEVYNIAKKIRVKKSKEIVFGKLVSIEPVCEQETYDLQVSDQDALQNYVCNGITLKNSGKDFICSIVALYEAMRLLESPGGNPYAIYNLGMADPFTILTIANSSNQAKILFRQIKEKVLSSEYFRDKIVPEGITSDSIHFLTPEDKRRNKELQEAGFAINPGSIVVKAGHSNSDTLVGISCFVLLLDEIGLYKNTAGSSSGDAIYNQLAPAVKTYIREIPKLDENGLSIIGADGKPETDKIYDGKIVCLSTPRGKDGIFYELYEHHMEVNHRLVCRAATWQVNPLHNKERLMTEFPNYPPEKFQMEFGAEFSGTAGENFFNEEYVKYCFKDKSLKFKNYGSPGKVYFAHLDPATSSHNYALVLAHREDFFNQETSKLDWNIEVDLIKYWSPSPGKPIMIEEVDDFVVDLNSKFCLSLVTYDHFNSQESISKLRKKGVPTKMTAFTKGYKNIIYDNLYQLVIQKRLIIPNHLLLMNEMVYLQRKWLGSGYKVYPKRDGEVATDDIVDALAGACYNCVDQQHTKLPQGKLINIPVSGGGTNDITWRSMSGLPYGTGPGHQVARNLERRSLYPRR